MGMCDKPVLLNADEHSRQFWKMWNKATNNFIAKVTDKLGID